jgi:hypothetical protein
MFDSRASLPNEVKADIEQFLNNARGTNSAWSEAQMIPVYIRRNIKLAEAPSYGKTIFEYEPNCNGAEDYKKVAEFLHAQYQGIVPQESAESPPPIEVASDETADGSLENAPADEMQEQSETQEYQPAEPAYIDINQVEPSGETEQTHEKPPIEIKEIQPTESQAPAEFTETTTDPNQVDSNQQQY